MKQRTAQNDENTDRILVDIFHSPLRVEPVLALDGDGNKTTFNIKVSGELLQRNLRVGAHDDVRSKTRIRKY